MQQGNAALKPHERRRHKRYAVNAEVAITVERSKQSMRVRIVDISLTGMGLICEAGVEQGDSIKGTIFLEHNHKSFNIPFVGTAQFVKHASEQNRSRVGMHFDAMMPEAVLDLNDYLILRETN